MSHFDLDLFDTMGGRLANIGYTMAAPIRWFIRWYLRGKIAYLERMIDSAYDNADIQRDGEPPDYWHGKRDGLRVALTMLVQKDVRDWS